MQSIQALEQVSGENYPKQKRSRLRRLSMIQQGAKLLNKRDLDDISIAEITGSLGFSTGSFYSAFDGKASFFIAVQVHVGLQIGDAIERHLETPQFLAKPAIERFHYFVDFVLANFRKYRGHIQSCLRHEPNLKQAWAVHRASGRRMSEAMVNGLPEEQVTHMRFAVQIVFGTVVNAVLHDPGPLQLDSEELGEELKKALSQYLIA